MSESESHWVDVEFVFADGSKGPGKAARVGNTMCDCISELDGITTRFWANTDGTSNPPYTNVRLAKPFDEYVQDRAEKERTDRAIAKVLLRLKERAESIPTHFRDSFGTRQPHTAKGTIKDFVAIVNEELAKVSSSE